MTDADIRRRAIALHDDYTHRHGDRRRFMQAMIALVGSAGAAEALAAGIAAAPEPAQRVPATDPRLRTATVDGEAAGRPLRRYTATPVAPARRGTVLVIHENRGLTPHIMDVARQAALAGFAAVAPDFLTPQGGTPADADQARALIGSLDYDLALAQAMALLTAARGDRATTGKAAAIGFCWGGAFVNRLAVQAGRTLDAGVSYYGSAPAPAEAAKVVAPLLIHLAGNDARVNATAQPWAAALRAAGRPVTLHVYPGVEHAFNNDGSAERYDRAAADLSWRRTTAFLDRHLR